MPKALVIIHFYYAEQVDTILNLLKNISIEYDLFCSISNQDEYDNIKNKVLKFNPNTNIIDVKNIGYDIWPFVYVINNVNLKDYDYIVKLHTKRDLDKDIVMDFGNNYVLGPGSFWRDSLYGFIATRENFNKCLDALKNPKIGMCARFNLIHNHPNHCGVIDYAKSKYPKYILNLDKYSFVAGTMFIAKAAPFQILKDMNIDESLFEKPTTKHETQFAHVLERTIGEIIYKSGMIISDPFSSIKQIKTVEKYHINLKYAKVIKTIIYWLVFFMPFPKIRRKVRHNLMCVFYLPYIKHIFNKENFIYENEKNTKKTMPKISVIIPVYNTEKYLAECLDSVLSQTFKDIEIICIDDGSTDNSAKILKQYAKKDKRIKIITQKNSGVISARNNAIAVAKGEYIYPLDSDDIITPDCLEQLYYTALQNMGDIITSRVMYFGRVNEEFVLPEPTKKNMARNNCLVNAALFKKSDFEKTGGYDHMFDEGLEDYDFWLNMLFKHNKKIYRVPEILFYYRLKNEDESRNSQSLNKLDNLFEKLHQKYPEIKSYLAHRKLIKKIGRFFFRIQDNKIKIFKIPVWQIRKYDTVVSVGAACFVPETLKDLKLRDFSGPFDWMYGSHAVTRLKYIKNGFKDYFNFEDFEYVGENPDNGKIVYKNKKSGIYYNHDFPRGEFKDVFYPIAEKYKRRTERFINHLKTDKRVLLVFFELNDRGDKDQIVKVMDDINKKYPAHIDLLYVNHNENMKLRRNTKLQRISNYVLYSEYHYDKYPDELHDAKKVCKKLIRKVAK